ncbi:MAG: hypothetical protein BroJett009_13540 [Armatimonadota bacterium]|nr:MAG: hypothetical protein BroJett009_13540 [Armatimonadota bacterium]
MAWEAYNTVNGMIMGEVSDATGALPIDYLTDALGSVVATVANGTVQNTYRWAGYGQQVHKTGTSVDPKFLWVGGWGYRGRYVRNRSLDSMLAIWLSSDPYWPNEQAYAYAGGNPATISDPTGLEWECWNATPSPCKKFEAPGKPYRNVPTPCGPISLPPLLNIPVRNNDTDAWCCWERRLRAKKGGFGYCMSQMAVALANIQVWLQRHNYPGKDKVAHCVIGCFAQKAVDSCCAYFLAIHLENKYWPKGNHDPDDYRATIEGMRCGETLDLPGWLWVCRWIPGLNQGVRETFYGSCYDCCMHKRTTGVLPQR